MRKELEDPAGSRLSGGAPADAIRAVLTQHSSTSYLVAHLRLVISPAAAKKSEKIVNLRARELAGSPIGGPMSVPSQSPAPDEEPRRTVPTGRKSGERRGPPVPAAVSAGGTATAVAEPPAELPEPPIELPLWSRVLGWCAAVGLIYLLICGVNILSRGLRDLSGGAAHITI